MTRRQPIYSRWTEKPRPDARTAEEMLFELLPTGAQVIAALVAVDVYRATGGRSAASSLSLSETYSKALVATNANLGRSSGKY